MGLVRHADPQIYTIVPDFGAASGDDGVVCPEEPAAFEVVKHRREGSDIARQPLVQEKRDWEQEGMFDDQRSVCSRNAITVGGRVAPDVLLVAFPAAYLEDVEVQGDCRPVNGVGSAEGAALGPEQRVDQHNEPDPR